LDGIERDLLARFAPHAKGRLLLVSGPRCTYRVCPQNRALGAVLKG